MSKQSLMDRVPYRANTLLQQDEPPPFTVINAVGTSKVVLVCDHASNLIPLCLKNLGLSATDLDSHIAWDPGAALVAKYLSTALDAPLVLSGYSRLVIDCNRPLDSPESIPESSAGVRIPGNENLTRADRKRRISQIFFPYQQAISQLLEQRNRPTVLISVHSFVAEIQGENRPWQIGVAGYGDDRFARALFSELDNLDGVEVGFNQPYAIEAEFDYTLPVQGTERGLHCAMVEIRQDELGTASSAQEWALRLAKSWRVAGSVLDI